MKTQRKYLPSTERESNIELLRIVLMTMILLFHFLLHGEGLLDEDCYRLIERNSLIEKLVLCLLCYHVNCFIFISGYYEIKLTTKKALSFLLMITTYSLITYAIAAVFFPEIGYPLSIKGFFWSLNPVGFDIWWFVSDYFVLLLLSPIINKGILFLTKKEFQNILFFLFFFSISGIKYLRMHYELSFLFLFIYLIGRYFRMYPVKWIQDKPILIYFPSVLFIVIQMLYVHSYTNSSHDSFLHIIEYDNPFCITAAIGFFFLFKKITFQNKIINRLAAGSFAAYLITDGYLRSPYNRYFVKLCNFNILAMILCAIAIVCICAIIENVRITVSQNLINKIEKRFKSLLNENK